jgi:catechol 2,3-dioxygenase-like lactoylglutathione lyase family enzyme
VSPLARQRYQVPRLARSEREVATIFACLAVVLSALLLAPALAAHAQADRPRILGVAHLAFYVSDLSRARKFYEDFLGFAEPFSLKRDDGSDRIAFVKINDQQYVKLFAEPAAGDGQLNHIAFYTDDARRMRDYLAARGVKVPDTVAKGRTGNYNFTVSDPDGHKVEIVQYEPDSWTAQHRGMEMPAGRVSQRLMHAGFTVGSLSAAMRFYGEILGFREFWRGSANGIELSWVNMRVPDGNDYVELMLSRDPPDAERRGVQNHICLETPDVAIAARTLQQRAPRVGYARTIEVRTGRNHKRQANLFDPDGTRVELMEPATIDGQPTPSSTAPPPRS